MSSADVPPRTGPGRPRDPGVDSAAIDAALGLLLEGGVEHASLERVARRAGVTKATLYRRWTSKDDLLAAAIESLRERMPTLDPDADIDFGTAVGRLLPTWAAQIADPQFGQLVSRMVGLRSGHPTLFRAWQDAYARPRREVSLALLAAARSSGVLVSNLDDSELLTVLHGAVLYEVTLRDEDLDAAAAEQFLYRLLRALGFQIPEI